MIDERRKRERKRREVLCADLSGVASGRCFWGGGVPSAGRERLHEALRDAIARSLTDRQRSVVEGYFFEGLSQGDLARKLGVTQQVVHKALFGDVRSGKRVGGALSRLRMELSPLVAPRGVTASAIATKAATATNGAIAPRAAT
jgi:hypothetical protein